MIIGAAILVWVLAWTLLTRGSRVTTGGSESEIRTTPEPMPWPLLIRRILPATAVDFCYGWMLWLFLNWLPSFFQNEYYQDLKRSAIISAGVFIAGVVGDTAGFGAADAA